MFGLINAAIQDLIVSKHGQTVWDSIAHDAQLSSQTFIAWISYPDSDTYSLVDSVAKELGVSGDVVLAQFGEHWVKYTSDRYPHLFNVAGNSLRDFLISQEMLHNRVAKTFTNLVPPLFTFSVRNPYTLHMYYHSTRKGLCSMIPGILKGLDALFQTPLEVSEIKCTKRGDGHCEYLINFKPGLDTEWLPETYDFISWLENDELGKK